MILDNFPSLHILFPDGLPINYVQIVVFSSVKTSLVLFHSIGDVKILLCLTSTPEQIKTASQNVFRSFYVFILLFCYIRLLQTEDIKNMVVLYEFILIMCMVSGSYVTETASLVFLIKQQNSTPGWICTVVCSVVSSFSWQNLPNVFFCLSTYSVYMPI